jgi:preprotein translocase subunit SecE
MFRSFVNYIKEVQIELRKVSWPTLIELRHATTVVIVLSLIFALFIMVVDKVYNELIGLILK